MANAARAPFYVPRPGDDVYWSRGPIANGAIRTTTTQVKFFGQPGQVPTKRWSPIYTFDDPAVWSGSPLSSDTIHPLLTAAGQVKPWRWLFGQDDPSVWSGSPLSSDTIHPLLTSAGQVKSKQWLFGLDDPSPWSPWTNRDSAVLKVTTSPFAPYPWSFNNTDDAAPWQYTYQRSTLTPKTFGFNLKWAFNFVDEPPGWVFGKRLSSISLTTSAPTSLSGSQWRFIRAYGIDDGAVWNAQSRNALLIQTTSTGTPFVPTQWRFGTPVDEPWQQISFGKPISLTVVASPFTPRQWTFGLSADEPWQQQTPKAQPLFTLAFIPFSPRFIPTLDEPPVWTYGLRPVSITLTATAPTPLTSSQWRFGLGYGFDDATVWNAQSRNAFFTQTFPVSFKSAMWNLNIPQPAIENYSGAPPTNINLFPPIHPPPSTLVHNLPFFVTVGKLKSF